MAVIFGDGVLSHVFIDAADVEASAKPYNSALGINDLSPFDSGATAL